MSSLHISTFSWTGKDGVPIILQQSLMRVWGDPHGLTWFLTSPSCSGGNGKVHMARFATLAVQPRNSTAVAVASAIFFLWRPRDKQHHIISYHIIATLYRLEWPAHGQCPRPHVTASASASTAVDACSSGTIFR